MEKKLGNNFASAFKRRLTSAGRTYLRNNRVIQPNQTLPKTPILTLPRAMAGLWPKPCLPKLVTSPAKVNATKVNADQLNMSEFNFISMKKNIVFLSQ